MRYVYIHMLSMAALFFVLAGVSFADDAKPGPEERFIQALSDYNSSLYALASAGARDTARLFPGTGWEGRALFLAGRADAARGELGHAAEAFGRSKIVYPVLADYADFIMAGAYNDGGMVDEAVSLYSDIAVRSPGGVLAADSLLNAGRALNRVGRFDESGALLVRLVDKKAGRPYTSEAVYLQAEAEAAKGNVDAVYSHYRRLWIEYPESRFAAKALDLARRLATEQKPFPEPDADVHLARARKFVELGIYGRAAKEYDDALGLVPDGDKRQGDALIGLGYTLSKARDNDSAIAVLSTLADGSSYPDLAPEALYWLSRTYLRTGKEDSFIYEAKRCGLEHPGSARAADCLYVLGTERIFSGEYPEAIDALNIVTKNYIGSDVYPDALWRLGWAWFVCGEYAEAELLFRELYERYPDTENAARGMYWRARALELLGDDGESLRLYSELASGYGNSYYGIIAGSRGQPLVVRQRPQNAVVPPELPSARPATGEAMIRASELGLMGMAEYGVKELRAAEPRYSKGTGEFLKIAAAYRDLGEYKKPMDMGERLYRSKLNAGSTLVPEDVQRVIFPAAYWDVISREADAYGIDPFLVAALVREESRFDPRAQSPAGAVGLMQLMPETASLVCRRLGRPAPTVEGLKQGAYNLPLGVCHLAYLLEKHGGRLVYVLAEYNAGPTPLTRWKARMPDAPDDVFAENVGYAETRNYIRRVMRNYGVYRRLYGQGF